MDHDLFQEALRELGILYSKTKKYILLAEQVDRQSRSNIAIFKEQRDALDHVMRAILGVFGNDPSQNEEYVRGQIENARGHMFRAAYDALDGTGISYKFRIEDAMSGISNEAISAVYPEYWDHVSEMNDLDHEIADHRGRKDEQRRKLEDLDDYCASIERAYDLANRVVKKVPAFQQWEQRNRRTNLIWKLWLPAGLILLTALLTFFTTAYFKSQPTGGQKTPSPTPTVSGANR